MKAIKITQEIKEKNKRYELSFVKNNNVGDVIKIGFPNKFHVTKPVSGGYKNRTDLHSKDGWKDVVIADHNPLTHRLGDIELQGDVYTHPIIQLDNETIINNVSEQLGDYLDEEYPLWERIKHTAYGSEAMLAMIQENEYDADRLAYVQSLLDWVTRCRSAAEQMVIDFLSKGTLPSFKFEKRP